MNPSKEPVHFMVDIETLDTIPSAVILSVGACIICAAPELGPIFNYRVAVQSQSARTQSLNTVLWWREQGNCPDDGIIPLYSVLDIFSGYLREQTERPIIWCKGTDFDTAILAHAYTRVGQPIPWKYNDVRDFRTVKKLFGNQLVVTAQNPNPHDALSDAIFQAQQLYQLGLELK